MTALTLTVDSIQCLSAQMCSPSRGTPWYRKSCCVNGATGFPKGVTCAVATISCAKLIKTIARRSSRTWPGTAFGLKAERPVRKIRDQYTLSVIYWWRHNVALATHLGRRIGTAQSASTLGNLKATRQRQSYHNLVIGNENVTSLIGKSMNWLKNSNDIYSLDVVGSHRLSVLALAQ